MNLYVLDDLHLIHDLVVYGTEIISCFSQTCTL